ncbi:MAG: hypothetical protein JKZ00_03935, partial [Flavobacteriaceae bacterium]|nr:hypothetical protein [Flavobacteriaceae bacterium]
MKLSITAANKAGIFNDLRTANLAFNKIYRGDREDRQPIHTVYGGANLFKSNTTDVLGNIALKSLLHYAPNFAAFGKAFQLYGSESLPTELKEQDKLVQEIELLSKEELKNHPAGFSYTIYQKVIAKLKKEGVEDFRIDFEDGFGNRSDKEEDETAIRAANQVAKGMEDRTLSPFIGIRIKPFTEELKDRGL